MTGSGWWIYTRGDRVSQLLNLALALTNDCFGLSDVGILLAG